MFHAVPLHAERTAVRASARRRARCIERDDPKRRQGITDCMGAADALVSGAVATRIPDLRARIIHGAPRRVGRSVRKRCGAGREDAQKRGAGLRQAVGMGAPTARAPTRRASPEIGASFWAARRPAGKARGASIAGLCERRATPPAGMHRRPEWRSYFRTGPKPEPRFSGLRSGFRIERPTRLRRTFLARGASRLPLPTRSVEVAHDVDCCFVTESLPASSYWQEGTTR